MVNKKYVGAILVGGKGLRLGNLTKKTPKPLLKINNISFLELLLYRICTYNFKKIFLICSYKSNQFFKKFNNRLIFGTRIYCLREKLPQGTGGALYLLKKKIDCDFLLFNGDTFFDINIDKFYNFSKKQNNEISIAFTTNKNYKSNKKLINLTLNNNLVIKNKSKTKIMNGGIYFIKKKYLKKIENKTSSFENDHIKNLISNQKISGKVFNNYFIDIGIKKNLIKAKKELPKIIKNKAVFLDRDGVINEDKGWVYKKKDFKILKGVISAIKYLNKKKFLIIIVTNQSGIGRKLFTERQFLNLQNYFQNILKNNYCSYDDLFFCPHHPKEAFGSYKKKCKCRKPGTKMIHDAIKKWSIIKKNSFMIGDKCSDKVAAIKAKISFFYKNKNNLNDQIKYILDKN